MKVLVVGSSNFDIFVNVENLPQKGETLLGTGMRSSFGGKGANQAVACGKLEAEVTFLSCVGNDDHGRAIVENLKSVGVHTEYMKLTDEAPTGTAIITLDEKGQNTIVVIAGANQHCDVAYLKQHEQLFKESDFILLQMEIPMEAIEFAIDLGHQYQKTVILNPAPALPHLNQVCYAKIDYLTPNETELCVMAKESDFEKSIEKILNYGVKNLIVTLGENGALWVNRETRHQVETIKVNAIDTVGAGDCFNGAFITSLAKGHSILESIQFANKASSIAVTRPGAQDAIPTLTEMKEAC